jgi:hypothetical protein
MFNQNTLLEKAAQAAAKKDSLVLKILIKRILLDDFSCLAAWEVYHSYSLESLEAKKRKFFFGKKLETYSDKALYGFLKLSQYLGPLRLDSLLYAMRAFPARPSVLLTLGEWALAKEAYRVTVWAWEGLELKMPYRKALVKLYSKLKLHAKAHDLAKAILKEDPYCTEMMDVLQASQFYQNMHH